MSGRENFGRTLRGLWATLAAILLLGAGVAFGVTRYAQTELERDATRNARKLAVEVLQPMLTPADVEGPIRGARYDELLAAVRDGVLAGSINGLKLWRTDGTILFADTPKLVGQREPDMREEIHAAIGATAQSEVDGDRYRTLVSLRVGDASPVVVAAELDQSHVAIVDQAKDRWYPWEVRAGVAAAVCVALYVATALFSWLFGLWSRRSSRRRPAEVQIPRPRARTVPVPGTDADRPSYLQPGFREEVEARRRVEEALAAAEREREELRERLRLTQAELEETRRRIAEHEPPERVRP